MVIFLSNVDTWIRGGKPETLCPNKNKLKPILNLDKDPPEETNLDTDPPPKVESVEWKQTRVDKIPSDDADKSKNSRKLRKSYKNIYFLKLWGPNLH